ncbi:MAG: hypothetical protein LBP98_00635 [Tannerella sp.]|jgi:hypothetical protein|nr:hypothetical protein [Tannerella sp.]
MQQHWDPGISEMDEKVKDALERVTPEQREKFFARQLEIQKEVKADRSEAKGCFIFLTIAISVFFILFLFFIF